KVYLSSNYGTNWTSKTFGTGTCISVASSSDGTRLVAGNDNGEIYTSSNSGATWQLALSVPDLEWAAVTSSADGYKLAAGSNPTTLSSGVYTWHHPILQPQLSGTNMAISWTMNQTGL